MGGNALKQHYPCRLPAEDARIVGEGIARLLPAVFSEPELRATVVPSYRAKQVFDEIAILVSSELPTRHSPDEIAAKLACKLGHLCPLAWQNNGAVLSLWVPMSLDAVFQVDLISAEPQWYDFALGYHSWGDLGGLMGRVAHHMGLEFSHDGLWLPIRDDEHSRRRLSVTQDFTRAIEFLGFDPDRFRHGFDTQEGIFRFVADGKRFCADIYQLEHRSHRPWFRDSMHPIYTWFQSWFRRRGEIPVQIASTASPGAGLPELFTAFPETEVAWIAARHAQARQKALSRLLNSDRMSRITGLHGDSLERLTTSLRTGFEDTQTFQEHILTLSDGEITALIATHYQQLQGTPQEMN